jgi:hypothetical protein
MDGRTSLLFTKWRNFRSMWLLYRIILGKLGVINVDLFVVVWANLQLPNNLLQQNCCNRSSYFFGSCVCLLPECCELQQNFICQLPCNMSVTLRSAISLWLIFLIVGMLFISFCGCPVDLDFSVGLFYLLAHVRFLKFGLLPLSSESLILWSLFSSLSIYFVTTLSPFYPLLVKIRPHLNFHQLCIS